MSRLLFRLILVFGSGLLAAGCASTTTPQLDARFGLAVRQARAAQTLHPEGARDPDPVAGIDGASARLAVERYRDSFKAPPTTFNVLSIGGQ